MSKVIVEIEIPVAQKSYEFFLPLHLTGFEVLPLITKITTELTNNPFAACKETVLCKKDDGSILDLNEPLWKLNIKNGEKLILV